MRAIHVFCQYNEWRYSKLCLEYAVRYLPPGDKIVLIDDCSPDPECEAWTQDFALDQNRVDVWTKEENQGLTHSWNVAFEYALEYDIDFVGVYNNDILIGPNFFEEMTRPFQNHHVGIVGPFSNNPGHQPRQDILSTQVGGFLTPEQAADHLAAPGIDLWLANNYRVQDKPRRSVPYVNGFCWMTHVQTIRHVGLFDPSNRMWGAEDEWQKRMANQPFMNHAVVAPTFVWHAKRATIGGEKKAPGSIFPRLFGEDIRT